MASRTIARNIAGAAALLAAMMAVALALAAPARANIHLDAPTTVSDDITRVHVAKLDADTHAFVEGAKMAIIEEETGQVVDEWVTGTSAHENEKGLNVNVVYVLRELEAPAGYDKVEDVRFVVNETEGTGITILSQGTDSELVESYRVNLYDRPIAVERETVVTQSREQAPGERQQTVTTTRPAPSSSNAATTTSTAQSSSSQANRAVAPKTGDETPLAVVGILVAVGVLAILLLQVPKRRMD